MRALVVVVALVAGCGVAPVNWSGPPRPPPRFAYVGAHGVPVAYGGHVCAASGVHTHKYPPVPRAAFVVDEGGAADTRTLYPYQDPHPLLGRTCFREGWHLHLERDPALPFDPDIGAYTAPPR
jgi:hypothetical protein